ncbi:MAG: carbamoyltransferase C-terminal domain-containing protein [Candidatus Thiodiazotropha sp.]
MSQILGIGGSIHDFSTCLIKENKEIIAIEDERLTRERYAVSSTNPCFPSLQYCLENAGTRLEDVEQIIGNDALRNILKVDLLEKITFHNHHLTHAYSAFFTSDFDESAILVVDGAGSEMLTGKLDNDFETVTYAYGKDNKIETISQVYGDLSGENPLTKSVTLMSNSIGELYRAISETIELGWLTGPGKTMGLAPYGYSHVENMHNHVVSEIMQCVTLNSGGQFRIKINGSEGIIERLYKIRKQLRRKEKHFDIDAAIASAGQEVLEIALFHMLDYLYEKTQSTNLCIVGGVALNSIANGKILSSSKFNNIHVIFAPGDNGTAIGGAIAGYMDQYDTESEIQRFKLTPYLGVEYSNSKIEQALITSSLSYKKLNNLNKEIARLISMGKVVGWYQGGSEYGPRALGNRSLLADPRNPKMRDHINNNIKKREWFRPLAPVVLETDASDYFDIECNSSWMQFVWPVKQRCYDLIPSVTHVDGSARVQTLNQDNNPLLYNLLDEYKSTTGVPMLLNTSFNINGEPIVETPTDAINSFIGSAIDVLVLGEYVVTKKIK